MKSFLAIATCAAGITLGASAPARAASGIDIVEQISDGTTPRTIHVQLDNTHMRTEITGPNGASQVVIFDGANQVLYIVDLGRKTYTAMTRADVDRLGAQTQSAMSAMQAQMANLPPAQRAQMEAMMKGRGMPGLTPPVKPEYKRNGTDKAGPWTCDKYDGYQNGEKTSEICTVSPSTLGFGLSDLDVTRQMAEFYSKLVPQAAGQISSVGKLEEQGFSGFPVKSSQTVVGRQITMQVTEAHRVTLPDSTFALPPGLTKQELPIGGGAPGRGR